MFGNKGKKKTSEEVKENKMETPNISKISVLHELSEFKTEVDKRLGAIENYVKETLTRLTQLQQENDIFKQYIAKKENIQPTPKITMQQDSVNEVQEVPKPTINEKDIIDDEKSTAIELNIEKPKSIYLPSPFDYNKFSVEDASNTKKNDSLYRIKLDDNSGQTGEIQILEDADFEKALNSPGQFLEPVCDYENLYINTVKRIENSKNNKGKVKREGDDWIVTERILIKFI